MSDISPASRLVETNFDPASGTPYVAGSQKWTLLISLLINNFVLLALYVGVLGVLLPNQIAALDPENKANNLAIVFAITPDDARTWEA